jgi:putative hydrolase of the HAD superfamily
LSAEPQRTSLNNSSEIKAVIFDYGKVIARSPTEPEFERMAKMFNVSFDQFFELWENSRDAYDCSNVTAEQYWQKLAAQTNSSLNNEKIKALRQTEVEIWSNIDSEMLAWLSQLQAAKFETGLLSNMPWDLVNHVRTNFKWMEDFAFKTFSAEVKLVKPDPAIYEHTLQGLGVAAPQSLFIDDREKNIKAARALGMHAILYQSISQLRGELKKINFPVLPAPSRDGQKKTPHDFQL